MYYNDDRNRRNGYNESRRNDRGYNGYGPRGGYDDRGRDQMNCPYEIN